MKKTSLYCAVISCSFTVILFVLSVSAFATIKSISQQLMQTYTSSKYYNEVCWLTSHNSFAYRDPLFEKKLIRANQSINIEEQLQYGVRSFMIDLYYDQNRNMVGKSKACLLAQIGEPCIECPFHNFGTSSYYDEFQTYQSIFIAHSLQEKGLILGARYYKQPFSSPFLLTIKNWLDDPNNSNDIITIHLESYVRNYDAISNEIEKAGLKSYLFDLCEYNGCKTKIGAKKCDCSRRVGPNIPIKWPTLGEMRGQKKRLVVFSDKSEDVGYGIMHVSNTMETQYDLSEYPGCEMRKEGREITSPLLVLNHFYKMFSINGKIDNSYDFLKKRVCDCYVLKFQWPNFIAVDLVDQSQDAKRIVLDINIRNLKCVP